ncbi:MAG: hypothetical protein QOE77_3144 [Blastocatellia bacterium]|jgi:hypothetical protein|nr:hypothetical protein [Blastocatellia bacterium]
MENKSIIEQLKSLCCTAPKHGANLRAYLDEELSHSDVEAFDEHLSECEKCSKIIYLEDYLNAEEIELLTRPNWSDDNRSKGRAVAATH